MAQDKERQIRLQFLDEAQEYLDSIESILLGLADRGLSATQIDGLLRSAHSIKGGAAMMDFTILSQLAHRIEDFFKVLQTGRNTVDGALEQHLLQGVDRMGQVAQSYRRGEGVSEAWLDAEIEPIFRYLHDRLGDPLPEDSTQLLSQEAGQDMRVLMFETEVESCLERLESIQSTLEQPLIVQEMLIASQELSCLGEMLELERFVSLCQSIETTLRRDESTGAIGASLAMLRRAQALVTISQWDLIPTDLDWSSTPIAVEPVAVEPVADEPVVIEPVVVEPIKAEQITPEVALEVPIESSPIDVSPIDLTRLDLDAAELISAALVGSDFGDDIGREFGGDFGEVTPSEATTQLTANDFDALDWGLELNAIAPKETVATSIDFAATDFEAVDFETVDFAAVDFEATAFDETEFASTDFADTDFATTNFGSADFETPDFGATDFGATDFGATDFAAIDLTVLSDPSPTAPPVIVAPPTAAPSTPAKTKTATPAAPAKPQGDSDQETTLRVPVKQLEQLSELFGELTTERNGLKGQLRQVRGLMELMSQRVQRLEQANAKLRITYDNVAIHKPGTAPENAPKTQPGSAPTTSSTGFDALEMDQYSDLHLISQEIIESVVQLQEVRDDMEIALTETEGTTREMSRTSQRMQIGLTQVRMRPIDDIISRFPRVLRELALTHNKPVNLKLRGKETLVERSVLDALNGPLMHLLRNCFDHGIEATADRLAKGKPAEGTIELSASYRGDNTVIVLKDDGGGINLDKISAKALTMGFTATDLAQASRSDLLNLIFEPGFSTAEQVTALSGRGVGMDVVRTNLTDIGGTIAIETEADRGTTFTISVPLSLAVRRVLLVEHQGFWMAFPSSIVEEFQLLHPEQVNAAGDQIEWQGDWIPLITLDRHLQFARPQRRVIQENQPLIDRPLVLIVGHQDQPYAIQVDRFWGEQEFTSRGVTGRRGLPSGFSSCVVLGDGRIVPLVDLEALLSRVVFSTSSIFPNPDATVAPIPIAQTQIAQTQIAQAQIAQAQIAQTTIMVIDDSINVRRFLALTLEKANYRVEQAKDGQDAIDKLKAGTIVDAIICDVEMPRLDGFGFLAQVKALPQHRQIPVTMLTSRSGTKHRQLAFSLGATAYFSKPFKQQDLLATLAELTTPAHPPAQLQAIGAS
jgi:two-component system, chemotaxis family, sensor histidine kinase and response regulator PixL